MRIGVVYKFKQYNKVNGTLFYCYEYCQFLRQFTDCILYITGTQTADVVLINRLFAEKYRTEVDGIQYLNRSTDIYQLKLDRTIILDIDTFVSIRGFLTGEVLCYSNDNHEMFRYSDSRTVTYFGSYDYQPKDVFSYLRLNFGIFRTCSTTPGVFISGGDCPHLSTISEQLAARFPHLPVYIKHKNIGSGDIFDKVSVVLYVHNRLDKNNRIIPEAFFHGKIVMFDSPFNLPSDSATLRFQDISQNGLVNYTLNETDPIISLCLK